MHLIITGGYCLAKEAELFTINDVSLAIEEKDEDFWGLKKMAVKAKMPASAIGNVQNSLAAKLAKAKEDMLQSLSLVSVS